jgi:hypothetical protein
MLVFARNTIILSGITLYLCTYFHTDSEFSDRCKNRHTHKQRFHTKVEEEEEGEKIIICVARRYKIKKGKKKKVVVVVK